MHIRSDIKKIGTSDLHDRDNKMSYNIHSEPKFIFKF